MAITFPTGCNTPRRRIEFCFNAREKLRLLHNKMGAWYNPSKPDITQAQYDTLPAKIRARYPFAPKLTQEQWDDFQENVYIVIDNKINLELSSNAQSVADSSEYTPDLEAIHGGL